MRRSNVSASASRSCSTSTSMPSTSGALSLDVDQILDDLETDLCRVCVLLARLFARVQRLLDQCDVARHEGREDGVVRI